MSNEELPEPGPSVERTPKHHGRATFKWFLVIVAAYLVAAYIVMPAFWEVRTHRHPALEDIPNITYTTTGIPGDPINVAVIGSEKDLKRIMIKAKWYPADPLTLKSCLEIAEATVLKRPYDDAPVSSLYYDKRKEDLAFEMPVGPDPRKRHHVRFWKTELLDYDGRPTWVGSATYDERVGLSDTTGEVTHHIGPDIDAERDHVMETLKATGDVTEEYSVPGFHKVKEGKNGGGDPWHTDGDLDVAVTNGEALAG